MKDISVRKKEYKRNALIGIAIVIAITIFIDILSQSIFFRFDLTKGRIYSISSSTRSILKELPDRINIKVFYTKDLPSPYNTYGRYIKDMLSEYHSYSKGKVNFEFLYPNTDPEAARTARSLGVRPVRVDVVKNDKVSQMAAYIGMSIIYGAKNEPIPVLSNLNDFEYLVTSKIVKLLTNQQKTVGFLKGNGEVDFFSGKLKDFIAPLKEQYKIEDEMFTKDGISGNPDVLVVAGPRSEFSDTELYALDQYIMKDKAVLFMVDNYDVDFSSFTAKPVKTNLFPLLNSYGLWYDTQSLVFDYQNERIGVSQKTGGFIMQNLLNYPLFLKISNFNKNNIAVKNMNLFALPFVTDIRFNDQYRNDTAVSLIPLMYSSTHAWKRSTTTLNPYMRFTPKSKNEFRQFVVMAEARGALRSAYPGHANSIARAHNARVMLIPTSYLLSDRFLSQENLKFFYNMIDYLVQDKRLISIRSKGIKYYPLKNISSGGRALFKYINLFLIPLLFSLYGILRWRMNKKQQEASDEE